jgi:hypothetical protein
LNAQLVVEVGGEISLDVHSGRRGGIRIHPSLIEHVRGGAEQVQSLIPADLKPCEFKAILEIAHFDFELLVEKRLVIGKGIDAPSARATRVP